MKNIYLDYNSHTPCDTLVVEAMNELWGLPGNPHSVTHSFGRFKEQVIQDALESFATIYDCFEDELIFTSGATEANNLAIFSGIKIAKLLNPQADTILTSFLEHKSVIAPLELASKQLGVKLIYIKLNSDGTINLEDLKNHMNNNKVLWLSCVMTHGVIGTNQPIDQISTICRNANVLLHVDASQAGYLPISCLDLDIDFLTLSAHKIYGPSGIGLLYSKHLRNPDFEPMIVGGGQQDGLRAGTLATPLIAGFKKAAELIHMNQVIEANQLKNLRKLLLDGLCKELPIEVIGNITNRHPGNLYLAIEGIDSNQLLNNLQPRIAFSLSSACDGFNREFPPLLKSIGLTKEKAETTLRICVGRMTTIEEIHYAIEMIVDSTKRIKLH